VSASSQEVVEALRTTLKERDRLRRENQLLRAGATEPIAIVGMACRYPGGIASPEQLWEFVAAGRDGISGFPTDRGWDLERLYNPDPENPGTSYVREGGFLTEAGEFDPEFFSISPREAIFMDPQERLLLESCWEALEDAGVDPLSLRQTQTGVFAGVGERIYGPAAGLTSSIVSGRVAYALGLEGPAISIDTACSSSLVSLHLAAQALRQGECTLALAGGVTMLSSPGTFITFSAQRGLAPDGRCKSFAEAADGTAWAEGVGMLTLERLSDAQRNGHEVLALLKGSAVNQDGASNGLTAPNGPSQERVIRQALANAGLTSQDIDAVEAHGTGTTLGDPIEAGALLATYGQERDEPLRLGSIKSNIGHTQAAAGVAGVIKMTEAIRRGVLPKTLHVDAPSSKVDWEAGDIELLTESREWEANGRPRRAGISSFGVSGTNAHLILEEAPRTPAPSEEQGADEDKAPGATLPTPTLLPLSAKAEGALPEAAERLATHLSENPDLDPTDIAYSLITTRSTFEHRAVALGEDREELIASLTSLAKGEESPSLAKGSTRTTQKPVFLFPGQGAQAQGMALDLIDASPAFAAQIQACEQALAPHVDWSLSEVLGEEDAKWLDRLDIVQPALFAVMVSLAKLWRECGVEPQAVVGHSQGEIAAAHIAGALSLEDAALIIANRGKAMAKIAGAGGMLSVSLRPKELGKYTEPYAERVSLAAINGPASLVLSGDPEALDRIQEACEADEIRAQRIAVDYAAHSSQIEELEQELLGVFAPIEPKATQIPLISTVTGEQIEGSELGAQYWYRNLRQTVLLEPVLRSLLEDGKRAFVEIGPHPVLAFGAQETIEDSLDDPSGAILLSTLRRDEGGAKRFALSLAEAHANGIAIDWSSFFQGSGAKRVPLPTYPFQRKRYWLPALPAAGAADASAIGQIAAEHPLLGAAIEDPTGEGLTLTGRISLATHPWLGDHAVGGNVLFPGTAFVELALRAAQEVGAESIEELTLQAPLVVPDTGAVALQVSLEAPGEDGRREIAIHSRPDGEEGEWTQNASGALSEQPISVPALPDQWPPAGAEAIEVEHLYDGLAEAGLEYGPAFQGLTAAWRDGEEIYAEVSLPEESAHDAQSFGLHPALLDAALHSIGLARAGSGGVELPFSWTDVALLADGAQALRVRLTPEGERYALQIADPHGDPVASVGSLALRAPSSELHSPHAWGGLLAVDWKTVPLAEQDTAPAEVEHLRCEPAREGTPAQAARGAAVWALETLQGWLAEEEKAELRLALVTRGAMATAGDESPDPVAAAIWGLVRSAQSEHPGRFALIDTDGAEASEAALPAALAAALEEPQLALREGAALAPRLGRVEVGAEAEEGVPAVDPERTVLITGATGVLGALTATHLTEHHGVRHLLLVSRSGAEAEGADELRARLEQLGAEVQIASCDVSDPDALAQVLDAIPGAHPLGAVFHCAGALADGTIETLEAEQVDRVFGPKAGPAWTLHELTRELELSAFVLFSSAAGTLGGPGQANYAAANVFLDALAQKRRSEGLAAISIAWGLWEQESSMTSHLEEADLARMRRSGVQTLSSEQGLTLLDAVLDAGRPQALAIPIDIGALRAMASAGALPPIYSGLVRMPKRRRAASGSLVTKLATLPEAERSEFVFNLVRSEVAAVLGYGSGAELEPEKAFKELGFDSLAALELRNRLSAIAGLRLSATVVFDYPNVLALAEHLLAVATASGAGGPVGIRAQASEEPIAIVGMACRFPGDVSSPDELWQLVAEGRDGIEEFPADRGWDLERLYDPDLSRPGTSYAREGGFLTEAGDFDAEFFGISPREALVTDPQQRLLLESCWEALEDAGIDPASLKKSQTGVFAGVMYQDYGPAAGNTQSIVSGRVAYTLGLEGPAISIDTACSSSLVSLHLAAGALRQGECTLALAGGVTALSTPGVFIAFSHQRGLAPNGRSKSFAEAADGAGFSEGVGVLVLERLSDAQRNGHEVLALLKGSAVNQDGASNGLTAPNGPSQERVIRQALANAGLTSQDIDAVEAHGTGTTLGDPIEAGALLATYGQERDEPLRLGSIKSNIGHTQAAAGVAGVIKMTEAIRRGVLPKTLHVDAPSSKVDWEAGDIELLTESREWEANGRPRRAGISSFGVSGTNAHLILEEAPRTPAPSEEQGADEDKAPGATLPTPTLLPLSAKAEGALPEAAERLATHLSENPDLDPTDIAYSLITTRSTFEHRAVALGEDREELIASLTSLAKGEESPSLAKGSTRTTQKPVFLFPGQGAQAQGMALDLIDASPAFAAQIQACEQALAPHVDWSLSEVLGEEDAKWLDRLDIVQPALFAVMVSLAKLWRECGVEPQAVVGHSQGEIAAAHIAGALSLEDAALIIANRGKAMAKIAGAGGMLSVSLRPKELGKYTEPYAERVSLAAINGPASLVLSGDPEALDRIQEACEADEIRAQRIAVDYAAHSSQIEELEQELLGVFAPIEPKATQIPLISTVTGEQIEGSELGAQYWYRNLRQTVLLEPVLRSLLEDGKRAFVEIGPHPVLAFGAQETIEDSLDDPSGAILLSTLRRDEGGAKRFALSLAEAHANGIAIDWSSFFQGSGAKRVPLPTYPFQRKRYWLPALPAAGAADASAIGQIAAEHPLLGAAIEDPTGEGLTLTGRISLATHPWLGDHAVGGTVLLPGTAFLELALQAAGRADAEMVEELIMMASLVLPQSGAVALQVSVSAPGEDGRREIAIHSRPDGEEGEWTQNASGTLSEQPAPAPFEPFDAWPPAGAEPVQVDYFYDLLGEIGVEYGPAFQGLTAAWKDGEEIYTEVSLADEHAHEAPGFAIHPALLDAALQGAVLARLDQGEQQGAQGPSFPFSWSDVALSLGGARALRVRLSAKDDAVSLQLANGEGVPVAAIGSLVSRSLEPAQIGGVGTSTDGLLEVAWVGIPLADEEATPAEVELQRCNPESGSSPSEAARRAALGALEAVQRWLSDEEKAASRLALITEGAVAAVEDESPDPVAAAVWGLVRSAQSEHPGRFALIDTDGTEASEAALPAALAAALEEPQLALREGAALAPRLARVSQEGEISVAIDPERTVLISGAGTEISSLVARHLEERHGAHHVLFCDAVSREALEQLLDSIPAEHPLGAVFHCEALLADGVVESLESEQIDRVFAAKVDTAWNLHELTRDLDLSAFVLFSSVAGTLGSPAQANYAAANATLDALALRRRGQGMPATAIAWGPWERQIGPSSALGEADLARMRRGGIEALSDDRGLSLLDAALEADCATPLAAALDIAGLRALAATGTMPSIFSGLIRAPRRRRSSGAAGSLAAKLATLPEAEAKAHVLELVRSEVAAVLGHGSAAEIDADRAFQELGFDSLTAVELRNRLSAVAGLRLPPTVVFDYPSSAVLAEHLRAEATANGPVGRVAVRAQASEEPIAIVGMACRYPGGVSSPGDLWQLVSEGRDGIAEFPVDRGWDLERIYDAGPDDPAVSRAREGGFLADAGGFDAEFFSISPREAIFMDPQERLLLESCWEALEDAGVNPLSLRQTQTGVFAGVAYQDYAPSPVMTSSVVSGRVSYALGLEGPAITVDTACSSSLVAMHLAAQALRGGECTLALAGGVTTIATPAIFVEFSRQRGLAADGRCKSFADAADGSGFAEGVGVLALERLSDAERAGHRILAVLRGSAVNQDGASNGLTAPNGPSQERVIRQALANARLEASDVDAVEAHGTGTTLGDPIEAGALLATYGQERDRPLRLGSLKSNIGHSQAAAGVGGVIKMVMAMRAGALPKTLHVDRPTTNVDWEAGEIELLTEQMPWDKNGRPRRAGVSSFGISGTNAHVILEEPPEVEPLAEEPSVPLVSTPLVLSAKAEPALADAAGRLASHLRQTPELDLTDVAYSLATTRAAFEYRGVAVGGDREELIASLDSLSATRAKGGKLAYLFSGQGSQRAGMGRELYEVDPAFADAFDRACEQLDPELGESLAQIVFTEGEAATDRLEDTTYAQPALFAIEVGLHRALASRGLKPDLLAGHSIGELVAAHVAGVFSLADAAKLVCARGRLMGALPRTGAMLAIAIDEDEARNSIEGKESEIAIAAINSPSSLVLSGLEESIEEAEGEWGARGRKTKRLAVSHAFHSPLMEPMLEEFAEIAAALDYSEPQIPIISNRTGVILSGAEATDPAYWVAHVREPVRFAQAIATMSEGGVSTFVEIGPDPVLCAMAQETLEADGPDVSASALIPSLREGRPEPDSVTAVLARAYACGARVEWEAFFKGTGAQRVPLPSYPFQRERYWLPPTYGATDVSSVGLDDPGHPLLGAVVDSPVGDGLTLTGRLSLPNHVWLAGHRAMGIPILPPAAFLELALHAAERVGSGQVAKLELQAPLALPERGAVQLQVSVGGLGEDGLRQISIHSRPEGEEAELTGVSGWTCHASGQLSKEAPVALEPLGEWPPEGAEPLPSDSLFERLADLGVEFGPAFPELSAAWRDGEEIVAEVSLSEAQQDEAARYGIHPALLEAALASEGLLRTEEQQPVLPFAWQGVALEAVGAHELRLRLRPEGEAVSLAFWDRSGSPVAQVDLLQSRADVLEGFGGRRRHEESLYGIEWVPVALPEGEAEPAKIEVETCATGGDDGGAEDARRATQNALVTVQRWLADETKAELRLALITEGAVATVAGESPGTAASAIWGLIRSAQAEHPGRFVLIDSDRSGESQAALPAALAQADHPQLVLRDGLAFAPRLMRLPAVDQDEPDHVLDPERTVLLTGATGGIGPLIARHLATEHGARHLLLVSRSGPEAAGAKELQAELEQLGVTVRIAACDVSQRDSLRELLDSIPGEHRLGAVVHAAGTLADATIDGLGEEELRAVFAPKADAVWHLHELTRDAELSAFVTFSSAVGTLGGPGQANYAAANAFLDALAQRRRAEGLAATSIAWGAWTAAGGMADRLGEADLKRMERSGMAALSVEQGLALFDAALAGERPFAVGIRIQAQGLRSLASVGILPPILSGLIRMPRRRAAEASAALLEHLATLSEQERERALLDLVRSQVAAVLGHESVDAIDPAKAFQDLGFDSLAAVELRNRLAMATGMSLQPTLVFDYPTSEALAEHLLGEATASGAGTQVVVRAQASEEPIAIVGMACRYPGGIASPESLWEFVAGGGDGIGEFPGDRGWDLERIYNPDPNNPGTSYAREGGFLADAGGFDSEFFSISPREAIVMDPQERLLLESSWEALEDAGIDPASLRKSPTGVFAGVAFNDYEPVAGGTISIVSGRVSYTLGLEGPAMTVDTACSSSLVAMHLASQALRGGECTLALAGGVTVLSTPGTFIAFSAQRGLAPNGRCKPFADAADGTGWGEGVGVLVLERLSDAERNGHEVFALLKGSAVNQDGASNGLTAPNGPSQERVIRQALANAGVSPQGVDVVEAHGTGTTLGDPIEAGALLATYGQERDEPLRLGSIKSNIGHTQAAAGVAGVIKMTQALRRGVLPKTLHVDQPSTKVDWEAGEIELLTEPLAWEANGRPRRAGVSSFGVSGTNAHLILEEAPRAAPVGDELDKGEAPTSQAALPTPVLLPLSAKAEPALAEQAERLAKHLTENPDLDPTDVAYSLVTSRSSFEHRAVALGEDREELIASLGALARGEEHPAMARGSARTSQDPLFLFPGQGAQAQGMALELIEASPAFAAHMQACEEALAPHVDWSLEEVLREEEPRWLERLDIVQPALFAVMASLAKLWRDCGVKPSAVVGHSQGEIAAAHIAGALSLEEAALIIANRGKAMAKIAGAGGMLSVSLKPEELPKYTEPYGERVSLAAINGPASLVLSGDPEALDQIQASCEKDGLRAQRIAVDYAAHSSQIEDLEQELLEAFSPIEPKATEIPLVSTVTGEQIEGEGLDASYWYRNLRQTVLLEPVLRSLLEAGKRAFLEIGPHPVLAFGAQETIEDSIEDPGEAILLSTLRRDEDAAKRFALSLAQAHANGIAIDWPTYFQGTNPKRVPLPTYPFQRERYWLSLSQVGALDPTSAGQSPADHPLLGAAVELAGDATSDGGLLLTGRISLSTHSWLADHAVAGAVLFPGTGFLELALKAAERVGAGTVEELTLLAPLALPERGAVALQVSAGAADEDGKRRVSIHARSEAGVEGEIAEAPAWTTHAEGVLSTEPVLAFEPLEAWPPAGAEPIDVESFYDHLVDAGLEYGPAFQGLTAAWIEGEEIYAEVSLADEQAEEAERFGIHPALLDAALHGSMLAGFGEQDQGVSLPFSWRGVSLAAVGSQQLRVRLSKDGEKIGLRIADGNGSPVAAVKSLVARPLEAAQARAPETNLAGLTEVTWVELPVEEGGEAPAEVELHQCEAPPGVVGAQAARQVTEGVLATIQGWLADGSKAGTRLAFVTSGAVAANGTESPDPIVAAIWGLIRSVQAEHPGRFSLIDGDGSEASEAVISAALAVGAFESQLALREGRVLAPRVAPLRVEAQEAGTARGFDPERTVLITGATGTLGALTARRLVERYGAKHLLLVSRSGSTAAGASELEQELEDLGAEVRIASCDVADRASLAELLGSIPAAHPLGAVVHCAGALADSTVEAMGTEQIEQVFVPKADAAWNLHELTADTELSAFVLFSSASGALGGPGQANYAAANVFLDALAEQRRGEGLPATSIAWGLWESQSSMTSHLEEADLARMRRGGIEMLSDEHGLSLLEGALGTDRAAVLAIPFNPAGLRSLASGGALPPILSSLVRVPRRRRAASGSLAVKLAAMSAGEREGHVVELVRTEAAFVLGHDSAAAVEPGRPFRDLGFDSLGAVELRNRLGMTFGLNLPATVVFDHPTAAELGAHLLTEMRGLEGGSAPPRSMFAWLRQQSNGEDSSAALIDLIAKAATLRATFDEPLPVEELPDAKLLADGPESLKLILLPSIMPTAGPAEYAQLAEQFRGERPVLALSAPGFGDGEAVPGSAPLALRAQAEAIQQLDLGAEFALIGHSSGGWFAQAAAKQLEEAGTPPQAVILMDTFFPPGGPLLGMRPEFLAKWWIEQSVVPVDDARLTATMSYFRIFPEWRPPQIELPIIEIRAGEPLGDLRRAEPEDPAQAGSPANGVVEVPGDHFSMMATHAATTAQAIREALDLKTTDRQPEKG
jgi:acyl transferase domain-containing protein/NAD(P)-dependent dehydrogenase (short-subunit alcohol dehydrogenase family)/acyl carrier protein